MANTAAGHPVRQVNTHGKPTLWGRFESGRKKVIGAGGLIDQHATAHSHLTGHEAAHRVLRDLHTHADPDVQTWAKLTAQHKGSAVKVYAPPTPPPRPPCLWPAARPRPSFAGGNTAGSPADMTAAYGHPQTRPAALTHAIAGGAAAGGTGALTAAALNVLKKRRK